MKDRKDYCKEYYHKMKEQDPNYVKTHYSKSVERMNSDPYILASRRYSKQMSSAKNSRGIAWRLDREKTIEIIAESTKCAISGRTLVFEIGHQDVPSIDRKDSRLGYTKRNIQITSALVNKSKGEMTDEEYINVCRQVLEHNGYIVSKKSQI
jgi:hypothetical protein